MKKILNILIVFAMVLCCLSEKSIDHKNYIEIHGET